MESIQIDVPYTWVAATENEEYEVHDISDLPIATSLFYKAEKFLKDSIGYIDDQTVDMLDYDLQIAVSTFKVDMTNDNKIIFTINVEHTLNENEYNALSNAITSVCRSLANDAIDATLCADKNTDIMYALNLAAM